jgi:DNA modification methylase
LTRRYINLDSIVVSPERGRREFPEDANQELQDSIRRPAGLLHAIVLEYSEDQYVLRAGERRLLAIKDIYALGGTFTYDGAPVPPGLVPYTLLTDLSELERLEVEIDENDRRLNPTWQERVALLGKRTKLMELQNASKGLPPPSSQDVAALYTTKDRGTPREELILSRHLQDPDVAKAKTAAEGFKILKRKEKTEADRALGASIGTSLVAASHTLLNEDSLVWMKAADPDQFDVILTDPPYGMGADEFGDSGNATKVAGAHGYVDTLENALRCYGVLAQEGFRIAKEAAHLYAFCDIDVFPLIKPMFRGRGWEVFRTPIIWNNPSKFRAPWPERGPQRKYECLLYAVKGGRNVTRLYPDVITALAEENLGHSAQKPVPLFVDLFQRSVRPGNRVLDPFCGTGPIFPAATELRCIATGIEIDQGAYGIAVKRIQDLTAQQEMPV